MTNKQIDNYKSRSQVYRFTSYIPSILIYSLLLAIIVLLPLFLWHLRKVNAVPFLGFTRLNGMPFEVFGGLASFTIASITWFETKRRGYKSLQSIFPAIVGLLVSLNFLLNISESTFDWRFRSDYIAFELGAKAIINGISPYINQETPYVYPPLVGQVMAFIYPIVTHIPFLPIDNEDQGWQIIFYLFQCCQFLLIILAYYLTYEFAKRMGLRSIPASIIVASLFLFNNSVVRTLNFHQTNLWILNSFLIAFLVQKSYPFISGFAVAIGIHIKLYPFILILPWIAMRRWLLLMATSIGIVTIAILQTNFRRDWTLIKYFLDYMKNVSKPTPYRNNSINSVVYNLFKIPNKLSNTSFDIVPIVVAVITLGILVWFTIRFIQRERIYKELEKYETSGNQDSWNEKFRFYGHSMDAIALGLLISPSVFEHHYIVAIPVALWAIIARKSDKPIPIAVGIFLVFCVPTFDFFPISFHRLVGLIMIVYFTNPDSIRNYFLQQIRRSQKLLDSNTSNAELQREG